MKKRLVFASNNSGKLDEIRFLLNNIYDILSLTDLGYTNEIRETGTSFFENAAIKANIISDMYNIDCFADDSGLAVDALGGAPGVFSARFAGEPTDYRANNSLLLEKLKLIEAKHRTASFITVIALRLGKQIHYFEGKIDGRIALGERGTNGFGYDPLFIPIGYEKTFAEMDAQTKNSISHRSIAVNKLVDFLKSFN